MNEPNRSEELKAIRRWYHEHGVPYLEEDWGERDEHGESDSQQTQLPERATRDGGGTSAVRSSDPTPGNQWWWVHKEVRYGPLWGPRTPEDARWVSLLDDFFAPYLAMMPRAKGNLLRERFGDLAPYKEASGYRSKQAAQQATMRALQSLTRLIAEDDPMFRPPLDGRRRDYDEEARAARRVLMRYLEERR